MRVIASASTSVHDNLAWEEWLLGRFDEDGPVLFFCINDPAVVVGKNQNPWRECDPATIRREGVALARRISGGGTVYHDPGNLNYSLILPRNGYHSDAIFQQVIHALRPLGLAAEIMPGNSLGVGGLKFSGNAFCYRPSAVLHHGTLLVKSDVERLHRYLQPALPDIESRAVASKPARVVNLSELCPSLSFADLQSALAREFSGSEQVSEEQPPMADEAWRTLRARHADWTWTHGYTPRFTWTLEADGYALTLSVEDGCVREALLNRSDGIALPEFVGCRFSSAALSAIMSKDPRLAAWVQPMSGQDF